MNTELKKRVLCYGDSNTWGYSAGDFVRWPSHIRWTGVLQSLLGEKYIVIEEGLNGRTTNLDYPDRHGKNGKEYLYPCMDSHSPLDYVILSIGPNDMKAAFNRSAQEICNATEELIQIIKGKGLEQPSPNAKLILVCPPKILENVGPYDNKVLDGATQKSHELAVLLRELKNKYDVIFVDLFNVVAPSAIDGVHFTAETHIQLGQIFYETICNRESSESV